MNLIKECFKYFQSIVYLNDVTYLFILVIALIVQKNLFRLPENTNV